MKQRGFLNQVVPAADLQGAADACLDRIRPLAPQAARLNKQTFRALAQVPYGYEANDLIATAYRYAPSAEHREGVTAFIDKRSPQFAD
jgi:enoyl-CoA hydratase/carnithine racemase